MPANLACSIGVLQLRAGAAPRCHADITQLHTDDFTLLALYCLELVFKHLAGGRSITSSPRARAVEIVF